jgi:hypothetical protein
MTHTLNIKENDPLVHLKAYGSVQIFGIDENEVRCDIESPQLATLVEEDGQVFITANDSCDLYLPVSASIEIEKVMGSAKITRIKNKIEVTKVFGNLVLFDIDTAVVEKVGGNFSVSKTAGRVQVEKVAGNLTVEDVDTFICEKIGGNCQVKNVSGSLDIQKAGGKFLGEAIGNLIGGTKIGGSFTARGIQLSGDLNVGGRIKLENVGFTNDQNTRAGGNIDVTLADGQKDFIFKLRSGDARIRIKVQEDDIEHRGSTYEYQIGKGKMTVTLVAGGRISLMDQVDFHEEILGDLSDQFEFEESALDEMIRSRVNSATKMAEAKVKSAEIRLEQIRERLEKQRGIDIDFGFGESEKRVRPPGTPIPPVKRSAGKKGATDEERLMILQMLQDKKISVEEAEILFRALEE